MARNPRICWWLTLAFLAAAVQQVQAGNLTCLACHSARGFREARSGGEQVSLYVDGKQLAASRHAGLACADCHRDLRGTSFPHKRRVDPVQCVYCHHNGNRMGAPDAAQAGRYADSVHSSRVQAGDPDAPTCKDCHGTHGIRSARDPRSSTHRTNIPQTCGRCHFDPEFANRHRIPSVRPYDESIHARVKEMQGSGKAAVCTDCHGAHDIKALNESRSTVAKANVPETCGRCHARLYAAYKASIHGIAVARGEEDAPVCTDCHGEHLIRKPTAPDSPVYPTHVVATCSKCHENMAIQRKYGLPAARLSSYISSYHGIANKYGDITVANCATCHGAHDILGSRDPRSAVSRKNLPKTCGKCHPAAGSNFAKGSIHLLPSPKKDAIVYWVGRCYTGFVVLLIGSFSAYILLDLRARWQGRLPGRKKGNGC